MLSGCHAIDSSRFGSHCAPRWGDVKKKQTRSYKLQAASAKPRSVDLDLVLDLESPGVGETTERKRQANKKLRASSREPGEERAGKKPRGGRKLQAAGAEEAPSRLI